MRQISGYLRIRLSELELAELDSLRSELSRHGLELSREELLKILARVARRSVDECDPAALYRLVARSLSNVVDHQEDSRPSILVVEDDDYCRSLFVSVFTKSGFDVVTASCVAEALEILDERDFSLIVSDFKMPGGDGRHFVDRLSRLRRGYVERDRIIFVTGCPAEAKAALGDDATIIAKPYSVHELVSVVLERLNGKDGS